VVWTYSGVRPLYDDGASSATAATRDYTLTVDATGGAPLLNVFGGKITTYRKLAESALEKINKHLPTRQGDWTAGVPLPGGNFEVKNRDFLVEDLQRNYPFLTQKWALRLIKAYGTEAAQILNGAESAADLGQDFGATLTEREVRWLMDREFAVEAADVIWRRSKLGLRLDKDQVATLQDWMQAARA
jgi:glycerol-3-phosphate dehydrogenase